MGKDSMTTSLTQKGGEMDEYMETCVFLQVSNSSAILILSARTVGFFFSTMPAWQLMLSTAIGQVLINIWVYHPLGKMFGFSQDLVEQLLPEDIVGIWIYDILWLLFLDVVKMTAGCIWERVKSEEIDKNPALAAKARKSRRVSNNLMPGNVVFDQKGQEKVVKRKSQRI